MRRRGLILGGLGTAGALVVGWSLTPPRNRIGHAHSLPQVEGAVGLNGWIRIGADGRVQLAMPRSEMGQGVHTALAMLVAEELDVPLASVQLVAAGADKLYGNVAMFVASLPLHPRDTEPGRITRTVQAGRNTVASFARELGINMTGGSSSVADAWDVLRLAAATARAQLLGAASLQWKLPVAELRIEGGVIQHASGPKEHFGVFAKAAAATPPGAVALKPASEWRLIGTAAPRTDVAAKCDGSARFGIDTRLPGLPGLLHAAIRHCPMLGGGLGAFDADAALKLPGVERVVRLGSHAGSTAALAVVGRTHWHAQRGAQALQVAWQAPPAGVVSSAAIERALEHAARAGARVANGTAVTPDERAADPGFAFHRRGDFAADAKAAPRRIERFYSAPYLAHAALEPINCTARVAGGRVEVWTPTQSPGLARSVAAAAAGVPDDAVTVHVTTLGGGFGRRLDVDFVGQAVRIALECSGRPVQLVWSREEDTQHDFYRPAGAALLEANLDAQGRPTGLQFTSAGDAVTPRFMQRGLPELAGPIDLPDKTTSEGLFDLPYGVPHQRIAHVATRSGVPVGFWRSVGHSHNAFFSEAFVDELAFEARQDPVAFRLAWLADAPRHAAVLKLAAERAQWGGPLGAGMARGVALHESFDSIVAQVAFVSLEGGRPKVHRVVCAADVGTVVNPGIVAQQMEGAVVFGLSAALGGRIDIDGSVVRQRNFPELGLVRLADAPRVETHLVPSTRHPGGVGEPGVPPIAPAVANALFALTGRRFRSLPLVV